MNDTVFVKPSVTLIGDGIENPANALVMVHCAEMFEAACRFCDTKGLAQSEVATRATKCRCR